MASKVTHQKTFYSLVFFIFVSSQVMAQPLIWNLNESNLVRLNLGSTPLKKLIKEAEKELTTHIITVVDKPMIPSSGNKHDYMSMGRYWWPDPNTKDGLPYIRKDGISNPEIEKLDRIPLGRMANGIKILSLAYYFTKEEKYAIKAINHLQRWFLDSSTKMNPHLNFGQTIPGRNNGFGRGEGIIDTYSFVEMLEGVELLKSSRQYNNYIDNALKEWFSDYLDWMLTSPIGKEEYDAKNNHGTAFDIQVVRFALFVGKEEIACKFLDEFPIRRLYTQIEPNGSQPLELARTTAFGYSVFNLEHILDICRIGEKLGYDFLKVKSQDGRSILKAIEFFLPYVGVKVSDFPFQQINNWDKVQIDYLKLLYRVDQFFPKPIYQNYYNEQLVAFQQDLNGMLY